MPPAEYTGGQQSISAWEAYYAFGFGAAPPRPYYFTWCDGVAPDGLAELRWEHDQESLR